ncbi:MAG: NADP-dependent oxidoreductase, partial [Porphyromonas sp.]|nr:NADP-dependent oxidoreductase [Porphyromonas sp.]
GHEFAGIVEEVGSKVQGLSVGDKVYGLMPTIKAGAFAEWAAVPASILAPMPEGLSYTEATSIPLTALTAYQALDMMQVQAGKTIFISGGSGGFGAMAIPLAKARGLIVYTSGNAASRERVLALGADRYFDYRTEDYLQELKQVDYVIDSVGGAELSKQIKLLSSGGHIVSLNGMPNGRFARSFGLPKWKQWLLSLVGLSLDRQAKRVGATYDFLFVQANGSQLKRITELIEKLGIRPTISKVFTLEEANDALQSIDKSSSLGKTVLTLE